MRAAFEGHCGVGGRPVESIVRFLFWPTNQIRPQQLKREAQRARALIDSSNARNVFLGLCETTRDAATGDAGESERGGGVNAIFKEVELVFKIRRPRRDPPDVRSWETLVF